MGSRRALFDEEHEAFRDSFATFVQRDAAPAESLAKVFAAAGRNGFLGMQVPDELGGAGVDDPRFGVVAVEEFLNAGMSGEGLAFATHVGVAIPVMLRHGSDEQRGRWLPAMASGDCVAGVVETPVRFSPLIGGGRLDGMATGVVNGASAGLLLVPADSRWGERLVVLVDPNAAGVRRSNGPAPLGMLGSGSCDVSFEAVDVFEQEIIRGAAAERLRLEYWLWSAVLAIAGVRAVLSRVCGYVQDRNVSGRPVAAFENTRYALAAVLAEFVLAESLVDACVRDSRAGRLR